MELGKSKADEEASGFIVHPRSLNFCGVIEMNLVARHGVEAYLNGPLRRNID